MKKIENWDSVQDFSEIQSLPIGPQPCKITKVTDFPEKSYLKVEFEIVSGPFKGWYESLAARNAGKWFGFIIRSYKDTTLGFFKSFITAVEKSNTGYKWDWNENSLVGKFVVVNYREEESIYEDKLTNRVRPFEFRSIPAWKEGKVETEPAPVKLSDKERAEFEAKQNPTAAPMPPLDDEAFPF